MPTLAKPAPKPITSEQRTEIIRLYCAPGQPRSMTEVAALVGCSRDTVTNVLATVKLREVRADQPKQPAAPVERPAHPKGLTPTLTETDKAEIIAAWDAMSKPKVTVIAANLRRCQKTVAKVLHEAGRRELVKGPGRSWK